MGAHGPARVLIADDEPDSRLLVQSLVEGLGFEAAAVASGEEALALALESCPDAILLDVQMAGMSGIEVCRKLRADARTATLPILLVTGNTDLPSRLAGFDAGADDYVCKPFDPRELAARLKARLELVAARCQLAEMNGVLATVRLILHEFNNPLQSVVGGLDLLRMARAGDTVNEEEAISMLAQGTQALSDLSHKVVHISEPAFKESPLGSMLDLDASR